MANISTFRELIAWQKSKELAKVIYRETATMPSDERFGLTNQMRRAAISVPSNIAEGFGRQTRPDYLRHLRIARGSLMELDTQYQLAVELKMLIESSELHDLLQETDRVLQGLIRSLERYSP